MSVDNINTLNTTVTEVYSLPIYYMWFDHLFTLMFLSSYFLYLLRGKIFADFGMHFM